MYTLKVNTLMPLFTISIPTIGRKSLKQTIDSVRYQTLNDWEIIVSDNLNSQKTKSLCDSYSDSRIRYIGQSTNLGPVGNPNFCLSTCKGKYLIIMHDDDYFLPEFLEEIDQLLDAHPSASWAIANVRLKRQGIGFDDDGHSQLLNDRFNDEFQPSGRHFFQKILAQQIKIAMPAVVYRNEICDQIRFDDNLIALCDLQMWLDLSLRYNAVYYARPDFVYCIGNQNGSIDRAHEGTFFLDALKLINWLESEHTKVLTKREVFIVKCKLLFSHSIIVLWMLYRHPISNKSQLVSSLQQANSVVASILLQIIKFPVLIRFIGLIGDSVRFLIKIIRMLYKHGSALKANFNFTAKG